jgi:hypothetical protein
MVPVLGLLAWIVGVGGVPAPTANGSYLYTKKPGPNGTEQVYVEPYVPHEGDMVLFNDHSRYWLFLYHLVGSDMPDHSGMVVRLPDGRPALLESAPDDGHLCGLYVVMLEALPRLHQCAGTIYVRRVKHPLTPEQSARLTDFALRHVGDRYALGRLLLQCTPFRARGPLRKALFGKTDLDRHAWLCSELVVGAGTAAGLFDPKVEKANAIYPRDLIYNDHYPLGDTWEDAGIWSGCAPAPSPGRPEQAKLSVAASSADRAATTAPK